MTTKAWALRPGELKSVSRAAQLRLAARCAMRVEPWRPPGVARAWNQGLAHVAKVARTSPAAAPKLARTIADQGALARTGVDELRDRCANYAGLTLSIAIEAAAHDAGAALTNAVIDAAKHATSIAALYGHAGRVKVAKGKDPVEVASLAMWDAIRADLAVLAATDAPLDARGIRSLAPLWPKRVPAWVEAARP